MSRVEDHYDSKLLTIVVPSYNSEDYLDRCIDSMLPLPDGVEVLIVNDGSTDSTPEIAQRYADAYPDGVLVINKPNGGHGSAINAGLAQARGRYFKVCDSDDWFDVSAYHSLIDTLEEWADTEKPDLVITNFVYDKQGKKNKHVMEYRNILPVGQVVEWPQIKRFKRDQYLLMHALCYRTDVLRKSGLQLPEKTFYVDNLYAFIPMPFVERIGYLDVDLYHYYIGRADQSVAQDVMFKRLDQQMRVNRLMIDALPDMSVEMPKRARWYMEHYLGVVTAVTSILLLRGGTQEHYDQKRELWNYLKTTKPHAYSHLSRTSIGQVSGLEGPIGRAIALGIYKVARGVVGFN